MRFFRMFDTELLKPFKSLTLDKIEIKHLQNVMVIRTTHSTCLLIYSRERLLSLSGLFSSGMIEVFPFESKFQPANRGRKIELGYFQLLCSWRSHATIDSADDVIVTTIYLFVTHPGSVHLW